MLKYKRALLISLNFFLFSVFWYFSNRAKLIFNGEFSKITLLRSLHNTAEGYTSILAYSVLYLIPFIFFIFHFYINKNNTMLVREKSRALLYKNRTKEIWVCSIIFSILHILVNVILIMLFFDKKLLVNNNFFILSFFQLITIILFFTNIGIIFHIIFDFVNQFGLAIILTFILYSTIFFFKKNGYLACWTPHNDLIIYGEFMHKQIDLYIIFFMYIKELVLIILLTSIGNIIYERKDFIAK